MQGPAVVENPADIKMVLLRYRPREFAADNEVGDVAKKFQIRNAVKQIQSEMEVRGHAVAMGLNVHVDLGFFSKAPPTFEKRNAVLQSAGANVRLEGDVIHAKFCGIFENRLEIVDRLREALAFNKKAATFEQRRQPLYMFTIIPSRADAPKPPRAIFSTFS